MNVFLEVEVEERKPVLKGLRIGPLVQGLELAGT